MSLKAFQAALPAWPEQVVAWERGATTRRQRESLFDVRADVGVSASHGGGLLPVRGVQ